MSLTLAVAANINSVDPQGGGSIALLNVDLRQQPGAGGFVSAEFLASLIASGSVSFPGYVDFVDPQGGGGISVVNVDLRGVGASPDYGSGGFFSVEVPTASLTAIAAPTIPTMSSAVSGALAGATYKGKVTYTGTFGESLASPEQSDVVATNSVPTVTSPAAATGATGWNVYLTNGATGTETKQNSTPIAIGTGFQLPNTGLIAGAAPPATAALVPGACTITVSVVSGSLVAGACTVTISQ